MTILNLDKFQDIIKRKDNFISSIISFQEKRSSIKDLLIVNLKNNIYNGAYSDREGILKSEIFSEELRKINDNFELFFSVHSRFSIEIPDILQKKSGYLVLAEGDQLTSKFWRYSKHKNISYWWLLSDGTLIASNESEKYGYSYISKKFKQF